MASYTLDSIRDAAEAQYGSTDITLGDDVVRLLNPLRLPQDDRSKLVGLQKELNGAAEDEDLDQVELIQRAIRLVAENDAKATLLIDAIGDDLAVLAQVFETYGKATQVGEASASAT